MANLDDGHDGQIDKFVQAEWEEKFQNAGDLAVDAGSAAYTNLKNKKSKFQPTLDLVEACFRRQIALPPDQRVINMIDPLSDISAILNEIEKATGKILYLYACNPLSTRSQKKSQADNIKLVAIKVIEEHYTELEKENLKLKSRLADKTAEATKITDEYKAQLDKSQRDLNRIQKEKERLEVKLELVEEQLRTKKTGQSELQSLVGGQPLDLSTTTEVVRTVQKGDETQTFKVTNAPVRPLATRNRQSDRQDYLAIEQAPAGKWSQNPQYNSVPYSGYHQPPPPPYGHYPPRSRSDERMLATQQQQQQQP